MAYTIYELQGLTFQYSFKLKLGVFFNSGGYMQEYEAVFTLMPDFLECYVNLSHFSKKLCFILLLFFFI